MAHDFKRFPELANSQMAQYYFDSPHRQITQDFPAKVVKVTDGDSVRLRWIERDFDFPMRFLDTDAWEMDTERGRAGQKWLEGELLGQEVDIQINPKNRVDKWGRLLGTIMFMGMNINDLSIMEGHAQSWDNRRLLWV